MWLHICNSISSRASIAIEIAVSAPQNVASLMMIGPVVLTAEERALFGQVYPKPFEPKADGSHLKVMWDYVESIGGNSDLNLHHREMIDTARAWQGHIKMYQKFLIIVTYDLKVSSIPFSQR